MFFYDFNTNKSFSYQNFIDDINKVSKVHKYCYHSNFYTIFVNIVAGFLNNTNFTLLDYDFTKNEIKNLIDDDNLNKVYPKKFLAISSYQDLKSKLLKSSSTISLFTSGTTGLPKKVSHSFASLTREVKYITKPCVWGFCYNPTHIAGLQVFFQALLNKNSIINLFKLSKHNVLSAINKFSISHISATPTFLRLLLPYDKTLPSVIKISSGGEIFDENAVKKLKKVFINASFLNIYALTEAGTILAGKNNVFTIKPKYQNLVKIVDNELVINKKLLGNLSNKKLTNGWYYTGDKVKILVQNPLSFAFVNRKNDIINVAGYNVNPLEVEKQLKNFDFIINAKVYGISNKLLGNVLACDVICSTKTSVKQIRQMLSKNLQSFKVPRIINFVDEIKTNRAGKIQR